MARFKARVHSVEAVQWDGFNPVGEPAPAWLSDALTARPDTPGSVKRVSTTLRIWKAAGFEVVAAGDIIARMSSGEIVGFKPDIFERLYEPT